MSHSYVELNITDAIATLTLNRAEKCNALDGEFVKQLLHELNALNQRDDIRVLIINAKGKHFCAGADISWMKKIAESSQTENEEDAQLLADLMLHIYHFTKPTIALVHGTVRGGGMGIVAAADIAIASTNASFGFPEVKIGITPSVVSPYILAILGERASKYYFLTGENFTAFEAKQLGLIQLMVDEADLLHSGRHLAQTLLKSSPKALMATKKLLRHLSCEKISADLAQKTAEHLANMRMSHEAQEGLASFIEKRNPIWT